MRHVNLRYLLHSLLHIGYLSGESYLRHTTSLLNISDISCILILTLWQTTLVNNTVILMVGLGMAGHFIYKETSFLVLVMQYLRGCFISIVSSDMLKRRFQLRSLTIYKNNFFASRHQHISPTMTQMKAFKQLPLLNVA